MNNIFLFILFISVWTLGDALTFRKRKTTSPAQDECTFCTWKSCSPSITSTGSEKYDALFDAVELRDAMKFGTTDKDRLISVLSDHTEAQRQAIVEAYKTKLNRDLPADISAYTSYSFCTFLKELVTPLLTFYTKRLNTAIVNTDVRLMIEIFTTLHPCKLKQMPKKYEELFKGLVLTNEIEFALNTRYPKTDFIDVLLSMARGERDGSKVVNVKLAKKDAKRMRDAIYRSDWKKKKEVFAEVFTMRSIPQLTETINRYDEIRKKDKGYISIEADLKKEMETAKEIYLTMIKILKNQPLYFAQQFSIILSRQEIMTEDKEDLINIARGRCDIDLENIKTAFKEEYKKTLYETISSKITLRRSYFKLLLGVVKP